MQITYDEAVELLEENGFIKQETKHKNMVFYKSQFGEVKVFSNSLRFSIEAYHPEWTIRLKVYKVRSFKALLKKMLEMDEITAQGYRDAAATVSAHKKSLEAMIASCEEAKKYPYTFKDADSKTFIHAQIKIGEISLDIFPDSKGMVKIKLSSEEIKVPLSKAIRIAELITE